MNIYYKETEVRQFLARNRKTGELSKRNVSNRNDLTVEKQMELLNKNDPDYEYIEYQGSVGHE